MKKVIATALGFHGGIRRRPGDVFEVPDKTEGKWFEPVDPPVKEPPVKKVASSKSVADDLV